jgi:molybdate transport system substrate-binding protein
MVKLYLAISLLLSACTTYAEPIRVAVASNFARPAKALATLFEEQHNHELVLAFGSTGKHFAQITQGAPFDIFLAADSDYPKLLEAKGLTVENSRYTYAIGTLMVWAPAITTDEIVPYLQHTNFHRPIAIANPKRSPYGRAAQQVLTEMGLWSKVQSNLVRGENIAQTYQFVESGNASLGFIAQSQSNLSKLALKDSVWMPSQALYDPIHQQAVLLRSTPTTKAFWSFLHSEAAKTVITSFGYKLP